MAQPESLPVDVPQAELRSALRQLEISLHSGVHLLSAVRFIGKQAEHPETRRFFSEVADRLSSGGALSNAVRSCNPGFDKTALGLIRAGEKSGRLAEAMKRVADYLEKRDDLRSKVQTFMIYPCIIFTVASLTLFFMTIFILPSFLKQIGLPPDRLPALTRFLMAVSTLLADYGWLLIPAAAGFVWYAWRLLGTLGSNPALDASILAVPLLGKLHLKLAVSRFVSTLAALLESGVSVLESLEIAKSVTGNSVVAREIDAVYQHVHGGKSLSEKFQSSSCFPPLVANMVATGEMSGRLPEALSKVSEYYDKEVDTGLRNFFAAFEPLLILFMGLVVAVIAAGMLLPLLSMGEYVQ